MNVYRSVVTQIMNHSGHANELGEAALYSRRSES